MTNDPTAPAASGEQAGEVPEPDACPMCLGEGSVRSHTTHLGPDDYDYDENCPACNGTGSADMSDAINSLGYWEHRTDITRFVVEREAVLRIVKARSAYAAAREAAERERVRGVLEAAQNDAMRFRWLTEDHADPQTRAKCRDLLSRMGVMTYSAACRDIDSAMAQTTKREMLRTAVEWQRRCEPTCAHGRYSDEDCADCPRTAAAARAELGDEAETARRREKEKVAYQAGVEGGKP